MQSVYPIALLLFALLGACLGSGDILNDVKNTLTGGSGDRTGMNLNIGEDKAKIGVQKDDGNPFFYVECSAGIDIRLGLQAGCERKWKPLFYACIAGGGVLAALLLSCCCCCCCAPCRRKSQPSYVPVSRPTSHVIIVNSEVPNQGGVTTRYDVPMLAA